MGYNDFAVSVAVIFVSVLVWFVLFVGLYVLMSLFYMKIFQKAGVQGNWRAWVPVYHHMVFFKLGDLSPWLVLYGMGGTVLLWWAYIGYLSGLALSVLFVLAAWRIGLKLQKDAVWVVIYVFLYYLWLGICAFDSSRWNPNVTPAPWAGNGFLGDRTVWAGVPSQSSSASAYGFTPQGYAPPAAPGYAPPAAPNTPPASSPTPQTPPAPPALPSSGPPAPPSSNPPS